MSTGRHFLFLWRKFWRDEAQKGWGNKMDYVGGDQIRRRGVKPGDVLWIVAVEEGNLYLLSRVVVDEILSTKEAQKRLRTNDLWPGKDHVLADKRYLEPWLDEDITMLAPKLRFESTVAPQLDIGEDGKIDWNQLRTMRQLTSESADLLEEEWRQRIINHLKEWGEEKKR